MRETGYQSINIVCHVCIFISAASGFSSLVCFVFRLLKVENEPNATNSK